MKIQSNPDWDQDGNCRVQKALAWWSRFAPCLFSQECLIYSQIIDSNVDDVLTPTFTPFIWIYSVKKTITSDDIYCESKATQIVVYKQWQEEEKSEQSNIMWNRISKHN